MVDNSTKSWTYRWSAEVYETLRSCGNQKYVVVAEAKPLYACRATGTKTAKIFSIKHEVALAAIPAVEINKVIWLLSWAYPQFYRHKCDGNQYQQLWCHISSLLY